MSSQRERFCQLIAFQGMTASQAYREAYNVGEDTTAHTVHVESSKIRNDPEVDTRIAKLKEPVLTAGEVTLSGHLTTLAELRDEARGVGELSVAVSAEVSRGRAAGMYVERAITSDVGLADLLAASHGKEAPKHEKGPVVSRASRKRRKR